MGEFMLQKTGTTLPRVGGLSLATRASFRGLTLVLGTLGGLDLMVNGVDGG